MRGRPSTFTTSHNPKWWIPAHAGETLSHYDSSFSVSVDPRACGVDSYLIFKPPQGLGGSPRMRGRQKGGETMKVNKGWIPAHAG